MGSPHKHTKMPPMDGQTTRIMGQNIQFSESEMTKKLFRFVIVAFVLLGCGCGLISEEKPVPTTCDDSLKKCVEVLGEKLKEQCYTTYHACVTKKD